MTGEEGADWMIGEQAANDPAITFGADDLGGGQVAQDLGDRGAGQAGRCGQVETLIGPAALMQVSRVSRAGSASTA